MLLLPSRNGARFLMRYNEPFPIFLSFLVCRKNVLLHFPAIRDKRKREHTSVRMARHECQYFHGFKSPHRLRDFPNGT